MQQKPVKKNEQLKYFQSYLSTAPVLGVIVTSLLISIWMIINYFSPDLLFFTNY